MKVKRTPWQIPARGSMPTEDEPKKKSVRRSNVRPKEAETERIKRISEFMKTFPGIQDVDLLLLKAHVLVEAELKRYLAFRLGLSDDDAAKLEERNSRLGFHHLANIALAGHDHRELLTVVSKLNDARTELAHRMDPAAYEKKLNELNDAVWGGPKKTPADKRFATSVSLANIWGQVVMRYLDGRFGAGTFESIMP